MAPTSKIPLISALAFIICFTRHFPGKAMRLFRRVQNKCPTATVLSCAWMCGMIHFITGTGIWRWYHIRWL
ncbi:hypothetical protein F5B21DRAFT_485294 [Xylaria acuta]|nr:hypothetical protein F5B21DRAFT_485294 [Xylaria acuta]